MGLTEKAKSAYRKFDTGKIIYVSDTGRQITLRDALKYLDARQKDCVNGFVAVEEIIQLHREGQLKGDELVHITIFAREFREAALKVKYGGELTQHVPDSHAISEVGLK